jgi:hypothetical protein
MPVSFTGHAGDISLSLTPEVTPEISWQPLWRELDLVFGLAVDATGGLSLLNPSDFATLPRDGVQLADVTVLGSEAGERIYAGVGSLIDAAGGDDELFNTDSQGGNILVGGQGADSFFLRPVNDRIIGGQLFADAIAFGFPPFKALVDQDKDTFLIDSSDPGSNGSLQIIDFELGIDVLKVDGITLDANWSAIRQQLEALNVAINAAPVLNSSAISLTLLPGVEVSSDLSSLASDPDGDTLQLVKLEGPAWVTTSGTTVIASAPIGVSKEQLAALTLRLAFSDGLALVPLAVQLALNEPPTALALTNTVSSLAENTSTASRIKVADIVVTDDALGSNVITLAGADAASFEVIGTELFLKAGTVLDFKSKATYAVTVSVSDPSLPGSTPVSAAFTLNIDDVSDPGPTNSINLTTPNQQIITFAADPGSPLPTIASVSNPNLSGLPAGIRLDQGIYAINYDDVPIGGSVTLTLFLPPGSNVNSYWKYGPPSQGAAEQWYDFRFDPLTETGATFQDLNGDGQNEVILRFRDGLRGDSDFAVNGRIIDPGAPAFDPSLLSPPTPDPPSPAITPPLPQPTPTPDTPKPSSKPQPTEPIPSKPTPTEPIPGVPSQRKPNIIRATADIDRLTGTPRRDIFVFSGVQSTSSRKTVGFDTIIDFQARDRIRIRNFNQKVISNPGNKKINALQGIASELSFDAVDKTLGKNFKGKAIGAFEVNGFSGTFLALNAGRKKVDGGRPGFDRLDALIFLEDYSLANQGAIKFA